jgi:hypothetical protein
LGLEEDRNLLLNPEKEMNPEEASGSFSFSLSFFPPFSPSSSLRTFLLLFKGVLAVARTAAVSLNSGNSSESTGTSEIVLRGKVPWTLDFFFFPEADPVSGGALGSLDVHLWRA